MPWAVGHHELNVLAVRLRALGRSFPSGFALLSKNKNFVLKKKKKKKKKNCSQSVIKNIFVLHSPFLYC
jgi:hypothetical protein